MDYSYSAEYKLKDDSERCLSAVMVVVAPLANEI